MNQSPESNSEALRSDIDETRRRMDGTMDALGERLQPQHLLDEVLGLFRRSGEDGDNQLQQLRTKVTQSADTAMHAVIDTVKKNPLPALLVGAGIAWMIYESRRREAPPQIDGDYYGYDREGDRRLDPDAYLDRPLHYPSDSDEGGAGNGSKLGELKEKIATTATDATHAMKEKLGEAGEAAREKAAALRERAGEKLDQIKERTGQVYDRTRARVVTTANERPLETGLACLAAGLIAGLLIPTPAVVNRRLGPTADRLRDRTRETGREMMEKGRRVANAAVSAVKAEAQAQGLTPERLRSAATRVAETTKETAEREGLSLAASGDDSTTNQSSNPPTPG